MSRAYAKAEGQGKFPLSHFLCDGVYNQIGGLPLAAQDEPGRPDFVLAGCHAPTRQGVMGKGAQPRPAAEEEVQHG